MMYLIYGEWIHLQGLKMFLHPLSIGIYSKQKVYLPGEQTRKQKVHPLLNMAEN